MEKHILSKSTFIRGTQCLKSLYLNKKRYFLRDRMSSAQRAVFQRGTDVGMLAQQLFPGGIDLKPRSPSVYRKKVRETMEVITGNQHTVLYEASFQYDRLLAILDILVKTGKNWTAYEVKSSLAITETYLLDAAFQYYVITHSGVRLDDFYLVFVNRDYVLGQTLDVHAYFNRQSVLQEVIQRQPYIEEQIEKEKEALEATSSPPVPIGPHCNTPYPCDFRGHCWKKVRENSLLYLDAFPETERFQKYYDGADDPEKTEYAGRTPLQEIQLTSARLKKEVFLHDKLSAFVSRYLQKPAFLSLLAIRPAVPFESGRHPYDVLPIAAVFREPTGNESLHFFTDNRHPLRDFFSFIQNILSRPYSIVTYDREPIMALIQQADKKIVRRAEEKITGLKTLLQDGTLYHYLLRGDDTPQHVAAVFLKTTGQIPDASKMEMNWQKKLLESTSDFEALKQETEHWLHFLNGFTEDFSNYLKTKAE